MLIQIFLILAFVTAFYVTWKRYSQHVITLAEAVSWSVLWSGGVAVTLIPEITERLASVFGVGRGVDLILYAAVAIQFFLIFKLFINHERMERKLTDMVRNDALKEADIEYGTDTK